MSYLDGKFYDVFYMQYNHKQDKKTTRVNYADYTARHSG